MAYVACRISCNAYRIEVKSEGKRKKKEMKFGTLRKSEVIWTSSIIPFSADVIEWSQNVGIKRAKMYYIKFKTVEFIRYVIARIFISTCIYYLDISLPLGMIKCNNNLQSLS